MSTAIEAAGAVITFVALCGALTWLVGRIKRVVRIFSAVLVIVERELEHNHGSSIKDDVHGIAISVGHLQRQVEDVDDRLTHHLNNRST